jgi:tetratricopeptide (TPR) repeat protein
MAHSEFDLDDFPFDLETLIEDAIEQILAHEDPQIFITWMRGHINDYYTGIDNPQQEIFGESPNSDPNQFILDSEMARALAVNFASMIWNGIPLPSNHFKLQPMAMPKRNDPCHCGSGKKYKHCCAQMPALPQISVNEIWPVMFAKLDKEVAARAIRENHVPVGALAGIASDYLDMDQPKKAITLLKPLFEGAIRKTKDDAEFAMTLLCNAYEDLGYHKKKTDLLQTIIDSVARSPLRSGAWQRQATIRIDNGDADGAWEAFQNAQRDDPHSISLSLLEVQILNAQGRNDKARERADFWVRHLRRAGLEDDEMPLAFLIAVSQNPTEAFTDLGLEIDADTGLLLKEWLETVVDRPVPAYIISDEVLSDDFDEKQSTDMLRKQFLSYGMDQQQVDEALSEFQNQCDEVDDADPEEDIEDGPFMPECNGRFLDASKKLKRLEQEWHEIYPLEKPFSVHETPFGDEDPWDVIEELEWGNWLQRNPAAFDSLDIVDDLATALMLHPQAGAPWLDEALLKPILLRAEAILEKVLATTPDLQLYWVVPENRPGLRALSRLLNMAMFSSDQNEVLRRAQRLIAINPNDNHGFRMIVMNLLIHEKRDEEALELAEKFPNDMNPEVAYGRVLALFRLGRQKEAVEALGNALEYLGKIPRYIIAKRVKKPKLEPDRTIFGGDDQAWYYREEMRDVWLQTAGAVDWLKKAEKAFL